jgi:uncharacterized protein
MAEGDLEVLRRAFERWNAGDHSIDYDTIDPDVELYSPLASTRGGPYRGHDGYMQWLADIDEQFDRWELRVEEWIELGDDRVLGLGVIHARGRGSGAELDQPVGWLFSLRDGKLIRYDAFYDHDEARRAAGLGN